MIARRMAPIGWIAGVAGAALGFYLVSLQVATSRTALESVERKIAVTHRQIRQLETEFSARASLRQLEAYNTEVLALAAPNADQYLTNEVQLASYSPADGGDIGKPVAAIALASAEAAPATPQRPTFKPAVVTDARTENAPVIPAAKRGMMIQTVAMLTSIAPLPIQTVSARPKAPVSILPPSMMPQASVRTGLLDDSSLGEIARRAAKEAKVRTQ